MLPVILGGYFILERIILGGKFVDKAPLYFQIFIAKRWKVKKTWVYPRTKEPGPGSMPRIKIGKYFRFDLTEVNGWLKRQNEQSHRVMVYIGQHEKRLYKNLATN